MLCHHPCHVFVAPVAITGTWGACTDVSFSHFFGVCSTAVVYSEVNALHRWFPETVWIVFVRKRPFWLWTAHVWEELTADWSGQHAWPWVPGHALQASLPNGLCSPPLQWFHCLHLAVSSKRTRFGQVHWEKKFCQETYAKLPQKWFIVVSATGVEMILNNKTTLSSSNFWKAIICCKDSSPHLGF